MRRETLREHYDALARTAWGGAPSDSGSQTYPPVFRAPYLFAESRLKALGLEGRKALDMGCGAGQHAVYMARQGASVTGLDLSPEALRVARARAERNGVAALASFREGDCEALPFPPESFDLVFSSCNLFCLDPGRVFAEIARVLRPDGHAVIVDTLGHNPLLRLARLIKRSLGLKPAWAVERIPRLADFRLAEGRFGRVELHFFDLATLPLAALRSLGLPPPDSWVRLAWSADRKLLSAAALSPLAHKVVCVLSGPRRAPAEA